MHSALTPVLVVAMKVMKMVVDKKVTVKKVQNRGKTTSILVSNRKLENSAFACRMQMHSTAAKAPSLADKDQTE